MSDTHETIAAILAEMRKAGRSDEHADGPLIEDYAERIEAAAERERDEDRQLAAIAESDEAFARCARCDRPERAPVNAAAMRDELNELDLDAHRMRWDRKYRDKREAGNFVERVIDTNCVRLLRESNAVLCDLANSAGELGRCLCAWDVAARAWKLHGAIEHDEDALERANGALARFREYAEKNNTLTKGETK